MAGPWSSAWTRTTGVREARAMGSASWPSAWLTCRDPSDEAVVTALPWSRYALVLVDLQHDFWSGAAAAAAPELPDRVAALLAYAPADRLTVVHVRARFRPDGSDWMARYRLRNWIPCIDGTPGAETLPFAVELPGEPVVTKQNFRRVPRHQPRRDADRARHPLPARSPDWLPLPACCSPHRPLPSWVT